MAIKSRVVDEGAGMSVMWRIFSALVGMSMICSCVANRSYRRGDVDPKQLPPFVKPVSSSTTDCSHLPEYDCVEMPGGKKPQHFYLAHIEFDDMGELWSIGDLQGARDTKPSQIASALTLIRDVQAEANQKHLELVVIAFVHGWHNNSSLRDEEAKNLASFKTVLQTLSGRDSLDIPDKPPVLVGIFLSWRGQSIAGDPGVTYWGRRDAAIRVGGPSMTEVVTRLMFETKGVPLTPNSDNGCVAEERKPHSHFAIIAHSFGARALEHALMQPMLSMILERQMRARECADDWNHRHSEAPLQNISFLAPADLVVFLNAANDAFEAKETIEALKRAQIRVVRRSLTEDLDLAIGPASPFMISITSDGDWATERIMPIAQWFSSIPLYFRHYDDDECNLEGQLCKHSQRYYYRHSEASIKEMRSHVVILADSTNGCQNSDSWPYFLVEGAKKAQLCFCIAHNSPDGLSRDCRSEKRFSQTSKFGGGNAWNDTPFFVIGAPPTLIPDHNAIFQDGTEELLIAISSHYHVLTRPTVMTSPTSP
jgi:hypothetical protein